MNVLIIGATGYVGTALDGALRIRGHRVVGTARSERARRTLDARATPYVRADVAEPSSLDAAIRAADAVVYAVAASGDDPRALDAGALRAVRRGLAGTEKTFAYVSDTWVYGATGGLAAREASPLAPPPYALPRVASERATLAMTAIGVRAIVVRPGIAYGRGGGLPAILRGSARDRDTVAIPGDGRNRWATIDVDDLGTLLALVVERGLPGRAYNAVNADRFSVAQIAAAAGRGAHAGGGAATRCGGFPGPLGACLALDQVVDAERARTDLGWRPRAASICADLEAGSYAALRVAV